MSCSEGLCTDGPTCFDEDNDRIVDSLDSCPGIANPRIDGGQPDVDSDGVGDACDPNPATAGDAIALAEMFGADLGRAMVGTDWQWASSGAVVSPPVPQNSPEHTLTLPPIAARVATIEVGFELIDLGPDNSGSGSNDNLVAFRLASTSDTGLCRLVDNDHENAVTDVTVGPPPDEARDAQSAVQVATKYVVRLWQDADAWRCRVTGDIVSFPATPAAAPGSITASVTTQSMQAAIHHIVVYSSP